MVYSVFTIGYEDADFAAYRNCILFLDFEDAEKYNNANPKSSNEYREICELENFEDAVNALQDEDGFLPDNVHELFMQLAEYFSEED